MSSDSIVVDIAGPKEIPLEEFKPDLSSSNAETHSKKKKNKKKKAKHDAEPIKSHIVQPPSLNPMSYLDHYDRVMEEKEEVIIVAQSGQLAHFASIDEIERLLASQCLHTDSSDILESIHPVWIDIRFPSVETMVVLSRIFSIHPLTMEDCLSPTEDQHQKHELFDTYRFISFSEFHLVPGTNIWGSVDVHIIAHEKIPVLLTLHNGPTSFIASTLNRLQAARDSSGLVPREHKKHQSNVHTPCHIMSTDWMMYLVLDTIVDNCIELVDYCSYEVEQLDELVLELSASEQTDLLRRFGEVRKRINIMKMQLSKKLDIMQQLMIDERSNRDIDPHVKYDPRGKGYSKVGTIKFFLRDIVDHLSTMLANLDQDKEALITLTNAYQARVSIAMSLTANEQNQVMKKFSAMATIILPLTFIPSLWGMNVKVPGEGKQSTGPFFAILGTLVGVGILVLIVFWKIKWL